MALHKTEEGTFQLAAFDAARLRKAHVPAASPEANESDLEFFGDMMEEQLATALRQVLAAELNEADDHAEVVYEDESLPHKKIRFAWLDGRWILADR